MRAISAASSIWWPVLSSGAPSAPKAIIPPAKQVRWPILCSRSPPFHSAIYVKPPLDFRIKFFSIACIQNRKWKVEVTLSCFQWQFLHFVVICTVWVKINFVLFWRIGKQTKQMQTRAFKASVWFLSKAS